jgi:hypothetical protein
MKLFLNGAVIEGTSKELQAYIKLAKQGKKAK